MRIVLLAGGTAGPLTPLLAVAQQLQDGHQHDIRLIVGPGQAEQALAKRSGISFTTIHSGKLRRYWSLRNILDLVLFVGTFFHALFLLRSWRPNVLATAGSFTAVPFAWAAIILRVPLVVHQQDVLPGLANRLCAPFARHKTAAFVVPHGMGWKKTKVIGNPVRNIFFHASASRGRAMLDIAPQQRIVVVLGGSSGASFLNSITQQSAALLRDQCHVVHVVGYQHQEKIEQQEGYQQIPFIEEGIADLLSAADVVVCRSGIGTLSELAILHKPVITIPMPGTHQEANANFFAEQHAVIALDQRTTDATLLAQSIRQLLQQPQQANNLAAALHSWNSDNAASILAGRVLDAAQS